MRSDRACDARVRPKSYVSILLAFDDRDNHKLDAYATRRSTSFAPLSFWLPIRARGAIGDRGALWLILIGGRTGARRTPSQNRALPSTTAGKR